jgi:hypothetical protein
LSLTTAPNYQAKNNTMGDETQTPDAAPPAPKEADEAETRRQLAGRGAYGMLVLYTTVAFCSGIYANAYCNFAGREVTFQPGFNLTAACDGLLTEYPNYQGACETLLTEHGVGFYGWYGTVPVDQQICFPYTLWNPAINGYITPDFDTKFHTAAAMAVLANCFGAFAWFTFMFSSCCPIQQDRLLGMSAYFFFACLFQGLSLLIFASDVCDKGFLAQYFPNVSEDAFDNAILDAKCIQGPGSRLAITATVFYFLCMNIVPKAIAPRPFGYRLPPEQATYNQAWNRQPPNTEDPPTPATNIAVEEA